MQKRRRFKQTTLLKNALPKKRGASAKKPNCFPMDLYAMTPSAGLGKPRPAHTLAIG